MLAGISFRASFEEEFDGIIGVSKVGIHRISFVHAIPGV